MRRALSSLAFFEVFAYEIARNNARFGISTKNWSRKWFQMLCTRLGPKGCLIPYRPLGFHILAIFFVVKFHAQVHVQYVAGFASAIGLCVAYEFMIFPVLAKTHTNSGRYAKGPLKCRSKFFRRARRASPVLKVSVGSGFCIQRHTVLTYMPLAKTLTANLLVSTM